jgi:hypothetical protein
MQARYVNTMNDESRVLEDETVEYSVLSGDTVSAERRCLVCLISGIESRLLTPQSLLSFLAFRPNAPFLIGLPTRAGTEAGSSLVAAAPLICGW